MHTSIFLSQALRNWARFLIISAHTLSIAYGDNQEERKWGPFVLSQARLLSFLPIFTCREIAQRARVLWMWATGGLLWALSKHIRKRSHGKEEQAWPSQGNPPLSWDSGGMQLRAMLLISSSLLPGKTCKGWPSCSSQTTQGLKCKGGLAKKTLPSRHGALER